MKILHIISGNLNGGAAKGAYWLHLGLKNFEIESKILTSGLNIFNDSDITSTIDTKKNKILNYLKSRADIKLSSIYLKRERRLFSTGMFGFDITKTDEYKNADIIHLHWINFGFINIKDLRKIKKPIVWTVRDMWPMTGGCHVTLDCDKYTESCGKCPQLNSSHEYDLSKIIFNKKIKYTPKDIFMVANSNWIEEILRKSFIFKDSNTRTICNNIPTKDFFPEDKTLLKEKFKLPKDKKIILIGAQDPTDFYKGFSKFIESLKYLDKEKYFLCTFGETNDEKIKALGIEYKNFGFIKDLSELRKIYSLADVFIAPSIIESFGKTIAESMCCGTPAVCFNASGQKDIIDHKINGYLAKPYEPEDLARGIEWILEDDERRIKLGENARKKVLENFDSKIVAKQYIDLYREILGEE